MSIVCRIEAFTNVILSLFYLKFIKLKDIFIKLFVAKWLLSFNFV